MSDFKTDLIALLERQVPELRNKIQAGAVDAETPVPYAAYSTPEETAIRTKHGIAGYSITFELSVYHSKMAEVEKLKHRVIKALEAQELGEKWCYYKSSEYAFYPDYNIHGYNLTFRII
ncbi:hypothetical protein BN938_0519 [Mucinivorans hirudinis]|uniref:Uncharacterized protein n=1 Tax=Mucinivorans hirudinis TaxID=1433126 RepID=A0A060RB43_9BACT|nr:hypothetical protein BN938_0519 [Mucinivorans hirudinis]